MLCDTPQELLDLVLAEAPGAEDVLSADNPEVALAGFCLWYQGGSVTHSVAIAALKAWTPACKALKTMFLSTGGRRVLALAMKEGRPLHEDCPQCLASHVMES